MLSNEEPNGLGTLPGATQTGDKDDAPGSGFVARGFGPRGDESFAAPRGATTDRIPENDD